MGRTATAPPEDPASARRFLAEVLGEALAAADPSSAVRASLALEDDALVAAGERVPLACGGRILVIAFGKASPAMARAAEAALGDRLAGGVVVAPPDLAFSSRRLALVVGGHPVPDEGSVAGAGAALEVARMAGEGDVVLVLVSGGGSSLLCAPAEGVTLDDERELTRRLLASGAPVAALNAVRKHLSRVKGGRLAAACHPARCVALLVSDVVGNDPGTIASGPTVADPTTCADALAVLERYGIDAPTGVRRALAANESPKPGDPSLSRASSHVILSNGTAIDACCRAALSRGVGALVLSGELEGESRAVGRAHAAIARSVAEAGAPLGPPALLVSGGETTVTVRGDGSGGPNQELVLACVRPLANLPAAVLSVDSDGYDGPTDAAGAVADGTSLGRGLELGMDPDAFLARNDSFAFLDRLGDLVRTGRTGTNVNDIRLVCVWRGPER